MKLKELLKDIVATPVINDIEIKGLVLDSRQVKAGDVFFAYPGVSQDRRQFLAKVVEQGAAAILVEVGDKPDLPEHLSIPLIPVVDLQQKVGMIAARFYGDPSSQLTVIGVTGTNGKSSICHLLSQSLNLLNKKSAVISTIVATQTTPDALTIQSILADFIKQGVQYAVIEVSSHALDQGRVNGVQFDYAVFSNLTRDHLDYHGDMKQYAKAKFKLFTFPSLKAVIINEDDPVGVEWIENLSKVLPVCSYSTHHLHPEANIVAEQLTLDMNGIHAQIKTPWGVGELQSRLLGEFNVSNLLAIIAVLSEMDVELSDILQTMPQLEPIRGRMETLGGDDKPLVVLDYAHTPDALAKALESLKACCQGRLFCVFGCGGNRDRGKRAQMARVAENYADRIIVTDDNPRDEASEKIIEEIMRGFERPENVQVESNRELAVKLAVQEAQVNDMILLAGKGHEVHQEIKGVKRPFDEKKLVRKVLKC